MKYKPVQFISTFFILAACISIMLWMGHLLSFHVEQRPTLLYAPPDLIKNVTFGYSDVLSDSMWIRVVQDLGLCEQNLAPAGSPRLGVDRVANCKRGWVFHMLNMVIELAPRWRLPAAVGPLMLSVVVDDIEGASILFKKVIKKFPEDWPILYRAAYHFLYETNDHLLAAQLFDQAGKHGAPEWVHSLSAKLYSESGRNRVALTVLKDALLRTPPGAIRDKIQKRLVEVEAKIAAEGQNK